MSESAEGPKSKTLYMIGNAHLDLVWLWQWQEGFQEAKATFRAVLDLMSECESFLFTSSSAAVYEWIEYNEPSMFAEISQRIAEGRWEIAGGWWVQPDCNLPCGESFVRQGLYGQRYFARKFGVTATVGYNVDSFGHAASLPQILLKSGLSSYVFTRPHPHEQRLVSRLFWWESDDGSRVLSFRIPYEYNTGSEGIELQVDRCAAEFTDTLNELMCFYGVGNHGGGPTRKNLASIQAMEADPNYPRLVLSTPSRYFESMKSKSRDLPVVHDELQHHATGCYSAHSGIKRWNRQAENLLLVAEKLSSLASCLADARYPDDLDRAWKDVLFNQFHDILAGTSIATAYEDARDLYGEAMAIGHRALNNAVQSLSWGIDIQQQAGVRALVVFNPHPWTVKGPVEAEFGPVSATDALSDAGGRQLPSQVGQSLATVSSGSRNRLSFVADVPAFGYQVYRLAPLATTPEPCLMAGADVCLENQRFRIEINPETGCLTSLYDKDIQFEWLRDEAAKPLVLADGSDTWGHGVLRYDNVAGEFMVRSVKRVERGPVKSVIRVKSGYGASHLIQDFTLYAELDRIEVKVTVDWHEEFKMLKLHFPLNLFYTTATYEIPYGFMCRPANGEEEPGQSWVDLTGIGAKRGRRMGLSVLNDGKYSFDLTENAINLTAVRSPVFAHHAPSTPDPDRDYAFLDQGRQQFTYTLLPHEGGWEEAGTVKRAIELNQPLISQVESCHPGPLPAFGSYLSTDQDNIVVTVLKRAEDNGDLIIRSFETAGRASEATIRLSGWNRVIRARFKPSEIKTFRVPADECSPVVETDLIERELPGSPAHGQSIEMPPGWSPKNR